MRLMRLLGGGAISSSRVRGLRHRGSTVVLPASQRLPQKSTSMSPGTLGLGPISHKACCCKLLPIVQALHKTKRYVHR